MTGISSALCNLAHSAPGKALLIGAGGALGLGALVGCAKDPYEGEGDYDTNRKAMTDAIRSATDKAISASEASDLADYVEEDVKSAATGQAAGGVYELFKSSYGYSGHEQALAATKDTLHDHAPKGWMDWAERRVGVLDGMHAKTGDRVPGADLAALNDFVEEHTFTTGSISTWPAGSSPVVPTREHGGDQAGAMLDTLLDGGVAPTKVVEVAEGLIEGPDGETDYRDWNSIAKQYVANQ